MTLNELFSYKCGCSTLSQAMVLPLNKDTNWKDIWQILINILMKDYHRSSSIDLMHYKKENGKDNIYLRHLDGKHKVIFMTLDKNYWTQTLLSFDSTLGHIDELT